MSRHVAKATTAPATVTLIPRPIISPVRIDPSLRPRRRPGNRSPVSEATAGYATAVTPPRNIRAPSSRVNDVAVAATAIATAHNRTAHARSGSRRTRSTAKPAGTVAAAATMVTAVASRPRSVCPMPNARSIDGPNAPTAPRSAASSASTAASPTTIPRPARRWGAVGS